MITIAAAVLLLIIILFNIGQKRKLQTVFKDLQEEYQTVCSVLDTTIEKIYEIDQGSGARYTKVMAEIRDLENQLEKLLEKL